ncbi:MAG TPA: serine/threonine-protein kinase, partial [Kofleriaceae bacterium]|nr:serine/threonine-protein kinase [Kofleriaceae bacterium]
ILALAALAADARSAHAGGTVLVGDLHAPDDLRGQAGAIALMLRSHLPAGGRTAVRWDELRAVLGGKAGPLLISDPVAAAAGTGADLVVTGTLTRSGSRVEVELKVTDRSGKPLGTLRARAPDGSVIDLVTQLLRSGRAIVGDNDQERPLGSVGRLRAFVHAADALAGGDVLAAAGALEIALPNVVFDVPAAREIAEAVWSDPGLPLERRLAVAIAVGDPRGLQQLADQRLAVSARDRVGLAASAAALINAGDAKGAEQVLAPLDSSRRDPVIQLLKARAAHARGSISGRDKALAKLLGPTAYPPALVWIAQLPAGSLSPALERRAVELAGGANHELASLIGLRALRAGATDEATLELIRVVSLSDEETGDLARAIDAEAARGGATALRLRAEARIRTGGPGALEDIERALASTEGQGDSRLLALKTQLAQDTKAGGDRSDGAATAIGLDRGEPGGAPRSATARSTELVDVASRLQPMLRSFPRLAAGAVGAVAIVPLDGSSEALYWPYRVHPDRLAGGLALALSESPVRARVLAVEHEALSYPPSRVRLITLAEAHHADGVLLYRLRADGSRARVSLVYYDVGADEASEYEDTIDGRALGLVSWNPIFVGFVGVLAALLLGIGGVRLLRGTGTVVVKVELDKAAERDLICVRLSRSAAAPPVGGDLNRFAEGLRRVGTKKKKHGMDLAPAQSRYERIAAGTWHVHVYGTYEKGGEVRAISGETSKQTRVRRGKVEYVTFDLVPSGAEYRLAIFDGERPVRAEVWLDDSRSIAHTDQKGKLLFEIPVGAHVLHVRCGQTVVNKHLHIADTGVHDLTINLERERKFREVANGLEISDAGPMQLERIESDTPRRAQHSTVAVAATAGAPVSPAAGTMALGSALRVPGGNGQARYRPDMELGRGAMGVVYRAFDEVLERSVALKVMSAEIRQFPGAVDMFRQEAKALAALNHPNIVTVFDQGMNGDELYLVMEFVEGTTLETILEQHRVLPPEKAIDFATQLCAGLAYAHGRRVIHRDIKPANIFITREGTVKLGDFGLARVLNEVRIKQTMVRGTPLYMSPEQIHGADIDFRADLYAVGCTLFEMVTGRPPFIDGEVLFHHLHTAPERPSALVPGLAPALDAVILSCIAKAKQDRVASAEALREQLLRL